MGCSRHDPTIFPKIPRIRLTYHHTVIMCRAKEPKMTRIYHYIPLAAGTDADNCFADQHYLAAK